MKKAFLIIGGIILLLAAAFICVYFIQTAPNDAGSFSVGEFSMETHHPEFQSDSNYGEITDFKTAARAGKQAVARRFDSYQSSFFHWMGCDVQYDQNKDAYHIRIYPLSSSVKGGAYDVILRSDGTVLAIWGEK